MDPTISAMKQAGLVDHMERSRLPYLGMKDENSLVQERKLEIAHFYVPLMFLIGGFIFALASVVAERCMKQTRTYMGASLGEA